LGQVQAEAAPRLRNGIPEQSHLLGPLAQVIGNFVPSEDFLLSRDDGGAHEVTGLGEDVTEIIVSDGVCGHGSTLLLSATSYMKYDV